MYLACPATTSFLAICGANYRNFFVRRIKNDNDDDDGDDEDNISVINDKTWQDVRSNKQIYLITAHDTQMQSNNVKILFFWGGGLERANNIARYFDGSLLCQDPEIKQLRIIIKMYPVNESTHCKNCLEYHP